MERRYDIDWIRVIAIGLLLVYHVAIGFQPWGVMIQFIANHKPWTSLWAPMAMLNVWRIPLLFFVSGMGVFFASRSRSWRQLITERLLRIFLPYVVGSFLIVPIHVYLFQKYYHLEAVYSPNPAHLWFLGNIFSYVLLLSPFFFYVRKNPHGKIAILIKKLLSNPAGLLIVFGAFIAEVVIVDPIPFEMYAMTWHGFFLGLLAFLFGFCFVFSGEPFWKMMLRFRWVFLAIATILFVIRLQQFQLRVPTYQLVVESECWIFTVLAFGYRYLNKPGKALTYLSQAAYPVYIVHMVFLYLGSMLVFPLAIPVQLQFILLLLFTLGGCLLSYEFIIRRVKWIRPLFGLNLMSRSKGKISSSYA